MPRRVREKDLMIAYRGIPYVLLGAEMLKWELKSLGYKTKGRENVVEHNGYETTYTDHGSYYTAQTREKINRYKRIYFHRPNCYNHPCSEGRNILFWITELIIKLNIKIRSILWMLFIPALICYGLHLLTLDYVGEIAKYYAYTVLISWGITIIFPLFARLWRKVFYLDEKTDSFLRRNGLKAWSQYDEYE